MSDRPLTQGRLASSVQLKLMFPVQLNVPGLGITLEWGTGQVLGSISKITREQSREVYRRYMLGTYAHEPLDVIPGKITTSLKLEKVVLYAEYMMQYTLPPAQSNLINSVATLTAQSSSTPENKVIYLSDGDLLGALGFVSGNLFYQQQPFALQEIISAPEGSGAQPTTTTYMDCWLTSNPIEYDIMDSSKQLTIQSCDVACGQIRTSIPFDKAVIPLARRLLTTSINFLSNKLK